MPIDIKSLIKPAGSQSKFLKLCIYGEYSSGKTTLAAKAPKPFIVDTEGSTTVLAKDPVLRNVPTVRLTQLEEFVELFQWLKGPNGNDYETIVIDTISETSKHFLDTVIKGSSGRLDAFTVPESGYERRNQMGRRFLADLLALPKHIILLSHVEEVKFNGIDRKVPQLSPKIREGILGLMDVVGYMYVGTKNSPTAENPTATQKIRYIQTAAGPTVVAKNRLDVPDVIEDPDISMFFESHLRNIEQQAIPVAAPTVVIPQVTIPTNI